MSVMDESFVFSSRSGFVARTGSSLAEKRVEQRPQKGIAVRWSDVGFELMVLKGKLDAPGVVGKTEHKKQNKA